MWKTECSKEEKSEKKEVQRWTEKGEKIADMREKMVALIRQIVIPFWAGEIADHLIANDVAPVVHGEWEKVIPTKSAAKWSTKVSCSICHKAGFERYDFCPNCGAKMDIKEV